MSHIHNFSNFFEDVVNILINVHLLALLIVNVTKAPRDAISTKSGYTSVNRWYRIIEFLAGLVTPLAKK